MGKVETIKWVEGMPQEDGIYVVRVERRLLDSLGNYTHTTTYFVLVQVWRYDSLKSKVHGKWMMAENVNYSPKKGKGLDKWLVGFGINSQFTESITFHWAKVSERR